MTTRKEWLANDRKTNLEVIARATDEYGIKHCERCGSTGYDEKEWRGLSISHTKEKGMGGTRKMYTADDKQLLCYTCHNTSPDLHNLKEVKI